MSNTLSRVPYEKTARQKRIAKRLESLAAEYWREGEELLHALQALVDVDAQDASKFRDACAAVGTVLASAGLAGLPAQWRDGFLKNADARFNACWAICDLLDAALNPDGGRFDKTYEWIMAEARSKPYFQDSLTSLSCNLMVERYRPIARDCRARAKLIAEESGESLAGLLGAPYSRNQGQDFLSKPAVRALQDWEDLNGGGSVGYGESGDLYGFPVGKAEPAIPAGIEELRKCLDESQRRKVERLRELFREFRADGRRGDADDRLGDYKRDADVRAAFEKRKLIGELEDKCHEYLAMSQFDFLIQIPGRAGVTVHRVEDFVPGAHSEVSGEAFRLERLIGVYSSWFNNAARHRELLAAGQHFEVCARTRFAELGEPAPIDESIERQLLNAVADSSGDPANPPAVANVSPRVEVGILPAEPFAPLIGWADIISALNVIIGSNHFKSEESTRDKIRKLNTDFKGPIVFSPGQGKHPSVDKTPLGKWWNEIKSHFDARKLESESDAESKAARSGDAREETKNSHAYGADATVVPGIAGSVKKNRVQKKKD